MAVLEEDLRMIHSALSDTEKGFFKDAVILITGCAGSLGYELVSYLLKYANVRKIIGIDNLLLGCPSWLKSVRENAAFDFYAKDIATLDLNSIPCAEEVSHIFHMASVASPAFYRKYQIDTMDANVDGCRNLLRFYQSRSVKSFCFFSSSEIYGSPDDAHIPTKEDYWGNVCCVGARACYDEAKRYSETLCWIFSHDSQFPCVILRPFNIFGPGMKLNDGRIPSDCAKAVMTGKDIPVYSDGTPTRTFCYISDAITWVLKAASTASFDIFNIGADSPELTVTEFAELCAEIGRKHFSYHGQVKYQTSNDPMYLIHNPPRRCPDLTYAKSRLAFEPSISTREGIVRFFLFLQENRAYLEEDWMW